MPKYTTCTVEGHWEDNVDSTFTLKVALGEWDGIEDAEDEDIFYYMDGKPLNVGDVISDGFVVTAIID